MDSSPTPLCRQLTEVAARVVEALPDPDLRGAFLFGSAAWGDADEASDIDLMVLVDRPAQYREVRRVRVAELLGPQAGPAPRFADLDRVSAQRFAAAAAAGSWAQRIVRCVILKDVDGWLAAIRDQVTQAHRDPLAVTVRFSERRHAADTHRTARWRALQQGDAPLAALHGRLALQEAGAGLIEVGRDRVSTTHFVESAERALLGMGAGDLSPAFARGLALGGDREPRRPAGPAPAARQPDGVARALAAYLTLAETLRRWMADPALAGQFSGEDRAWADFTYAEETYDEIAHKVGACMAFGRIRALQYYLDSLLLITAGANLSKVLALRATGSARRLPVTEFHAALRAEPELFTAWVDGLRLGEPEARGTDALIGRLIGVGEAALARTE